MIRQIKVRGEKEKKKQPWGYAITSMAISSRTGAAGCALAALRYLHYNKEQQQQWKQKHMTHKSRQKEEERRGTRPG